LKRSNSTVGPSDLHCGILLLDNLAHCGGAMLQNKSPPVYTAA